jgi:uncharacterized membrane protein
MAHKIFVSVQNINFFVDFLCTIPLWTAALYPLTYALLTDEAYYQWRKIYIIINIIISIQSLGRFSRNQSPVRRPVWLWHAAS